MKYKKLKNGKYEIIDMNIITYEEVIMKLIKKEKIDIIEETKYYEEYYKCIKMINRKLRTKKEIQKIARNEIVEKLVKEGYIDDLRYTRAFIHDKLVLTQDGPLKIKYKLISNGIPEDIVNEEINKIDKSLIYKRINKIINQYGKEKGIKKLLNKGYSYEDIKQ